MQFLYLCEKCVRREGSSVVSVSLPFSCFLSNHHPLFFCCCCFYGLEVPSELSIPKNHFIVDFSCLPPDVVSTVFSKCCRPRVCKFPYFYPFQNSFQSKSCLSHIKLPSVMQVLNLFQSTCSQLAHSSQTLSPLRALPPHFKAWLFQSQALRNLHLNSPPKKAVALIFLFQDKSQLQTFTYTTFPIYFVFLLGSNRLVISCYSPACLPMLFLKKQSTEMAFKTVQIHTYCTKTQHLGKSLGTGKKDISEKKSDC